MDRTDLFLNKEYIEFYKVHKHKQDNVTDLLDGNICRMCVCDTEEELYQQYFHATYKLQQLLRLQVERLKKQKELGYGRKETD